VGAPVLDFPGYSLFVWLLTVAMGISYVGLFLSTKC
jgi:hypothetical protein